jgi:membrane protein DedA with SNARE-associated domain
VFDELAAQVAAGPWALPLLAALVLGDAFLVVIPGEAAVTAAGALAAATGSPPLAAVVAVAAAAAFAGDVLCYVVGRRVGLDRWRWMRHPRVRSAFDWAGVRLAGRTASALFVARFIPFARLALNLTAGATRVPAARYLPVAALAATGWALYQAVVGAIVASIVPGGPVVAVVVSVVVALALGFALDLLLAHRERRTRTP